jgi:Rod binding domain-containing protein
MTPIALPPGLAAPAAARPGAASDASPHAAKPDPKLAKIAQEFESIFLRNLLKPLEKSGQMGKQGSTVTSGSGVYGSMMVGALADSASSGGGIGLAHVVLEALTRGAPHAPVKKSSK